MDISGRVDKNVGVPAIQHPDSRLPAEVLSAAYVALVAAIARHEPDALRRVSRILRDVGPSAASNHSPGAAVLLARGWLEFTGRGDDSEVPEQVFAFAFPATLTFHLVGSGSVKSARRRAMHAIRALQAEDVPLGAISGPHPTHPALRNVTVWVGSFEKHGSERLELELAPNAEDAKTW